MHLNTQQAWNKKLIRYLAEQVVSEPVGSLEKLPGGGCHNYEINHHIILKLPANIAIWESWIRQASIAPFLQQSLNVQVPQIHIHPVEMQDRTYVMAINYEKIPGDAIPGRVFSSQKRADKVKIFEQISDAMIALHSVDLSQVGKDVPLYNDSHSPFQRIQNRKTQILQNFILGQLNADKRSDEANVLCHTDLHSENLCIKGQKLMGLLDFDLMVRGNVETEFRPNLYSYEDMNLWMDIYQYRSGNSLNTSKIKQMKGLWMGLRSMMMIYNIINPLRFHSKIGKRWERHRLEASWNHTR